MIIWFPHHLAICHIGHVPQLKKPTFTHLSWGLQEHLWFLEENFTIAGGPFPYNPAHCPPTKQMANCQERCLQFLSRERGAGASRSSSPFLTFSAVSPRLGDRDNSEMPQSLP